MKTLPLIFDGNGFYKENEPEFEEVYYIDGLQWSEYGPVFWNRVKKHSERIVFKYESLFQLFRKPLDKT